MGESLGPDAGVGRRILVVEDEAIIAMTVEEFLHAAKCVVVGPVPSLRGALRLMQLQAFDAAILDFRLSDGDSEAIADILDEFGIPFLVMTAQAPKDLPPKLREKNTVFKPFSQETLALAVERMLDAQPH